MIYRIKKYTNDTLQSDWEKCRKIPKIIHEEWYQASRKGRIFGFWHALGHEYDWWDGDLITYRAETLEDIEKYIEMWHKCNYGNNVKYEIIKDIKL